MRHAVLLLLPALACATVPEADAPRFAAHTAALHERYDLAGFTVVAEPPFVVVGDEAPERVRQRAERVVRWCCGHLRTLYFAEDPETIHTIWLFRDEDSYTTHTKEFFDHEPGTPFGYFSRTQGLVMNIGTGAGTLCHEIVHAYVRHDFPDCPDWLNEGLGSLYEQCTSRDGTLVGLPNWRLGGLQRLLRENAVPSLEELCTRTRFYGPHAGRNYAQARYLCLWLQEQERLVELYQAVKAGHEEDPTGYQALVATIGADDMAAWEILWQEWVLALRYPQ